jgi:Tfp pilus assembly ATPase PilU
MPDMADLGELQKKHTEAARFASGMAEEKDPERLKEMAKQLQARCAELGRMARALEAAMTPSGGSGAETRVALTPEQRQRIAEQTGSGVEMVTLRDSAERAWSRQMPGVAPREIEAMAARDAAASRLRAETRTQVEKIIRELEKLDVPELAETLAELRRDPTLGLPGNG